MKGQAIMFVAIFVLFVFLISSKWPQAATALMVVVLLGLIINRWPQIQAVIYGS